MQYSNKESELGRMDELDKLKELAYKQLRNKKYIKREDWDDYVQEVWIYIYNRKGAVDIEDPYIYGDIKNSIINSTRSRKNIYSELHLSDKVIHLQKYNSDNPTYELFELEDMVLNYEYGYLFIDRYILDISVDELVKKYNISRYKIYHELSKIRDDIKWVYK